MTSAVAALSTAKPPRRPADGAIADLDKYVSNIGTRELGYLTEISLTGYL